jgi:two-component system cell cycle sensor histidine kinase/response regulator CckA
MSLCENAREAIPAQGTIAVTTGIRELAASADPSFPELASGRYAVITIRDDGRGMPAEVVDRVFEPFFTTRAFGTGAGLGLATSYAVIEHHEGTILVASSPGEGTEFTVLLPLDLRPQPATVDTRPPARPEGRSTETILLAEDDYSVRDLAVRVLRRANYEVLTAEDGREAVTVFTRHADDIDLVILDMVMPGLDGRETRDAIHALRPDVPILFASGFDPATLAAEHDLAPDEEVLAKPYGVSDLLKRVREILDRRLKDTVDHGERRQ